MASASTPIVPAETTVSAALSPSDRVDDAEPASFTDEAITQTTSTVDAVPSPEPIAEATVVVRAPAVATAVVDVPTPVTSSAPTAPALEPRTAPTNASLYSVVAAAFPEQSDRAYRIVLCESNGNPAASNGVGHYSLWQFDVQTWRSVGGIGLPSAASVEEQVLRARTLYERRGWSPWGCA